MAQILGVADKEVRVVGPDGVEWHIRYIDSNHSYHASNGRKSYRVPGVTGICGRHDSGKSAGLSKWASNCAADRVFELLEPLGGEPLDPHVLHDVVEQAREAYKTNTSSAGDRGTRVHDWAERFVRHQLGQGDAPGEPDADIAQPVRNFTDWWEVRKPQPVMAELIVFHPGAKKHDPDGFFAGTFDLLAVINGEPTIVDLKSSNWKSLSMVTQVAAYREAIQFRSDYPFDEKPNKGIVVMLDQKRNPNNFDEWVMDAEMLDDGWRAFRCCKRLVDFEKKHDPWGKSR